MKTQPYTASNGRKFGLTVGGAFALFAAISLWRGHSVSPYVLGGAALILIVFAVIAPTLLESVESAWMKLAHAISRVTTPVFMGIVYFVVLTPVGALRRLFGSNPMVHEPRDGSYWKPRASIDPDAARRRMERQF